MIIFTDTPLETDVPECRRLDLGNRILFIALLEFVSVIGFIISFFLVHLYSDGPMSNVLQAMTLVAMLMIIVNVVILLIGSLWDSIISLDIGFWWSTNKALFVALLGCTGGAYFIYNGRLTVHYLTSFSYWMNTLTFFKVFCHDLSLIHSHKRILGRRASNAE